MSLTQVPVGVLVNTITPADTEHAQSSVKGPAKSPTKIGPKLPANAAKKGAFGFSQETLDKLGVTLPIECFISVGNVSNEL